MPTTAHMRVAGVTKAQTRKAAEAFQTIPALPNIFPFNELLLGKGGLKLSAKTREWKWDHTGPVLLYTSKGRIAWEIADAHKLDPSNFQLGAIVGIGWLLPVRPNTADEAFQIETEFGNGQLPDEWSAAYFRYEFINLRTFKNPVVWTPPKGAIRTFRVPISVVAKELKKIGIDPKTLTNRQEVAHGNSSRKSASIGEEISWN